MSEVEKYIGIYSSPSKYPKYGHSNHGARAVKILSEQIKPESVLDVGCGWNEFSKVLSGALPGARIVGMDFACPGADLIGDITDIPFSRGEFDVVTAFDVLEHLAPESVDLALSEMSRVSGSFIFSISYVDSVNKWNGQTLHPTVRNEEWWIRKLMCHGAVKIEKKGRFILGKWSRPLVIGEKSVVLVGNGPSVLRYNLGASIDQFDEVIRFNNFKIEGFEKHTGSKTTLWSTFFRRIDPPVRHNRVLCIHESDSPPDECDERYFLPSWFYNETRKQAQSRSLWRSGFNKDVEPILASSGLLVTTFLLSVLDVPVVYLAGFDHFSKARSGQHHYWLKQSFKQPKEHDGESEAAMFRDLAESGRVRYLGS